MEKIAMPYAFSSIRIPAGIFAGIIHTSEKFIIQITLLFLIFFTFQVTVYGQQVIGSFPEMEGGFENATAATQSSTTVAANTQLVSWTGANATSVPAINTTIVRTGAKSLQWTTSSTSHVLFSKSANTTAIANATSYVVQFYWWKGYSGSARNFNTSVGPAGTNNMGTTVSGTLGVSATSFEWTKETVIVTTGTNASSPRYGLVMFQPNGGSFGTSPGYLFDDFCIYAGSAADNTAPADVTSPQITGYTSGSLNLAWTAPAGGVDGGGYVVVRYTSNPTSEPSPNANGIYAVGNSLGTGTIVYTGTATSFNNTGLSSNTAYYYKVFAVDKAFNYSPDPVVFSGFTGIAGPTGITFTTPASCTTDRFTISWTGPLNYNPANNTQLAFLKAGSAVTAGTPTNAPAGYTASTTFGSGTAYQNDAAAYCVYNGDGTNGSGDHSGLTITGLSPNTTYYLLIYNILDAGPTYSTGKTGNGTTLNSLAEPANNPGSFAKGTVTTGNIPLTWAAAGGSPSPTGYLLQASNSAAPADPADFTDPADQTSISGGTANIKSTGTSYSGFTGFSPGTMYYFRINSYTNTSACINFKASGPTINVATLPNTVTSQSLSITGGTGTINWSAATGYNNTTNTTLVFVSSSAISTGTPTNNPSTYTANTTFGAGSAYQLDANAKCVYNGDGTTATVTGLVSGTTYYVLILTVVGSVNYDGTYSYSAYATTSTLYNSANEYTWQGGASNNWTLATSWNPNRNSPSTADVLIFNTAGNVMATNVPAQTLAKLSINAGNVTLQSSSAITLTITDADGVSLTDLSVAGSTSLTLGSTVSMTLSANTTANIVGTLNVNSGSTYNTDNAGAITTVAGTINNYNAVTSTVASRFVVISGGIYNHAKNGGTIPTGTWNTNSTCLVTGSTSTQNFSGHKQTFSKFVWDCPSQSHYFVLGENSSSTPPNMVITDSFIVKRTNGQILQLSSTGGQRDLVCGNYFQYGGIVAITYNTDASGEQRSLTVNKTFYVTDSLESNAKFQIINNPGGENIVGRLFVGGNVEMHPTLSTSTLERIVGGASALAEIWFNGSNAQQARFSTISGSIDFVTNQTGPGVTLLSNATANLFKLVQGTFFIASNTLTINNVVSYPSPGTGAIGGSSSSNLIMGLNGAAGTLNFANGSRTLKDFTQMAGNSVSLGTELAITAGASPGRDSIGAGATLTTNDNLILRSDANGTARLAQMTATSVISGKVTVERYLPMGTTYDSRRWRLLTAPFKTSNAPTINAAWQEGVSNPDRFNPGAYDPKPGYGTHITRSTTAGNGFDQGSTNNPSIYYYDAASPTRWTAPGNTNSDKITDHSGCYMLFARGDRSIIIIDQFVNAKPTTLEPKGELNAGDVTIPLASSGLQAVGNPYASQVKLDNVTFNGAAFKNGTVTVNIWDPLALGATYNVGKFITCKSDGGPGPNYTYTYTGNVSAYSGGVIESSGAFIVPATGGNVVFHETDKTISSSNVGMASRPKKNEPAFGKISKLYTDLVFIKNGVPSLADGVASTYNKNYKNSIDDYDALKLITFNTKEVLSIKSEGQLLAIERRSAVSENDIIFLNISRLVLGDYQFNFRPFDFDNNYTPFLVDRFLDKTTEFSLLKNSTIPFSITADTASSASNRFHIIFKRNKQADAILLKAQLVNDDINLEWDNPGTGKTHTYTVERSEDGTHFSAAEPVVSQQWTDENPLPGNYFYRIRFMNEDGDTVYSNIAMVEKITSNHAVSVFPNPVRNGLIGLHPGGLAPGNYSVRLINSAGQVLYKTNIQVQSNEDTKIIEVKNTKATGIYKLEIRLGNKKVALLDVLMQQ